MQAEHVEDGEQEKQSSRVLEGLNLKLRLITKSSQQHSMILRTWGEGEAEPGHLHSTQNQQVESPSSQCYASFLKPFKRWSTLISKRTGERTPPCQTLLETWKLSATPPQTYVLVLVPCHKEANETKREIFVIPANCPGMSRTVQDLLLLSPVPHARCYLPWMSQKIWSPTLS